MFIGHKHFIYMPYALVMSCIVIPHMIGCVHIASKCGHEFVVLFQGAQLAEKG